MCCVLCALPLAWSDGHAAALTNIPARNATSPARLTRSDPGYLQYLEGKSLLGSSRELARIVSGSQIMWQAPATDPTPERLLQNASVWLSVHPVPLLTHRMDPVFGHLSSPVFWKIMRQIGMEGLYIAPSSGTASLWRPAGSRITDWDGMTQFPFTDTVGDDRDYGLLLGRANQGGFFLGLEMTQAATGLGPDFFLGARGNSEFQRLYRMVEIPPRFWNELPKARDEWDCQTLLPAQADMLAAHKLLPAGEKPHAASCEPSWGWAVTGIVPSGDDGAPRRFAYRYYRNPLRPIMDWEDPKAGARRILSACAIRRIGTQGAALLGMQIYALRGLNPGAQPGDASQEPALSAARSIGREVRRYGAWTWLEDELSLPQTRNFVHHGPDFAVDTVSSPGAEHALLTGDAELLRFMYDEARRIGLDQHRLLRRLPDERGLSYALPHLCSLHNTSAPLTPEHIRQQAKRSGGAWAGSTLYTGSAGLAALALEENFSDLAGRAAIRQGQSLLLFFKAMQPGLLMVPARDLRGALPLDGMHGRRPPPGNEAALAMHGAYTLLSTADDVPAGREGLPRADMLYPPLDVQEMQPAEHFLHSVDAILQMRRQTGIAAGRLVARLPTHNPGSIGLLFALPGNQSALLTVCNFSRASIHESFKLNVPEVQNFARDGIRRLWGASSDASAVSLGPWQGAAFLLGKASDAAPGSAKVRPLETASPASPYTPGVQRLHNEEHSRIVQPGENLHDIAAQYTVSPQAIMERNRIPSPDLLVEGRTLIIPAPSDSAVRPGEITAPQQPAAPPAVRPALPTAAASQTEKNGSDPLLQAGERRHVVQSGDMLSKIAKLYHVRTKAIQERNELPARDRIMPGQTLIIPADTQD